MYLFNSGTKHTRQETKSRIEGLPDINICPCSTFFDKFNSKKGIVFKFHCQDVRYKTSEDIIQHIKNSRTSCYYHAIIFDIIQYLYPCVLCMALRIKKEDPYKSCIKRTDISVSHRHLRPITNPELSVHTWDRDITKNANWFCVKTKIKEEPGFEFMVCNIFKKKNATYQNLQKEESWKKLVELFQKNGLKQYSEKRSSEMHSVGSTCGFTNWPRYEYRPDRYSALPRPYMNSKPGGPSNQFMKEPWFVELAQTLDSLVFYYLTEKSRNSEYCRHALSIYHHSKTIIPECLRICGTAFTNVTMVGESTEKDAWGEKLSNEMSAHVDHDDIITAILHVGDIPTWMGRTQYWDHKPSKFDNIPCNTELFVHGKVQIGLFHKVYHGHKRWNSGNRFAFNFIMKKSIYDHFDDYGDLFYSQLQDRDYDSYGLLAQLPIDYSFKKE